MPLRPLHKQRFDRYVGRVFMQTLWVIMFSPELLKTPSAGNDRSQILPPAALFATEVKIHFLHVWAVTKVQSTARMRWL